LGLLGPGAALSAFVFTLGFTRGFEFCLMSMFAPVAGISKRAEYNDGKEDERGVCREVYGRPGGREAEQEQEEEPERKRERCGGIHRADPRGIYARSGFGRGCLDLPLIGIGN